MDQIIDLSKQQYPHLPGAEYLQFIRDDIPPEVKIIKTNVFETSDHELEVMPESTWHWFSDHGFAPHFNTPEDALAHYFQMIKNR